MINMQNAIIVKGRLVGPTSVQLDEPLAGPLTEVEVLIRPAQTASLAQAETLAVFLRSLPEGTRLKEEIDAQLHDERASWEEQ
jgi:hypothetical protein